jgi:hypothetical protein
MLFLFGTFLVALVFLYTLKDTDNTPTDTTRPFGGSTGGVVSSGSGVRFNDPKKSTDFTDIGANVFVSDERSLGTEVGYSIAYFADDQSFAIDVNGKPTAEYREKASRHLLQMLQVSETEACKLNIYVGVTYETDNKLFGNNLGLSFCPGSVQL